MFKVKEYDNISLTSILAEVTVNSVDLDTAIDYINEQIQLCLDDFAQTIDLLNEHLDNHYLSKANMMTHVIRAETLDEANPQVFSDSVKHVIDSSYVISRSAITLVRISERIVWLTEAFKTYTQSNSQEEKN